MSDRPRVLILGSSGQLGRELKLSFSGHSNIVSYGRDVVNFAVEEQLRAAVRNTSPDVILNAAAYTAVDRAESEPELALAVNARAPAVLAEEAERKGILLVHYSTDYVFDGTKAEPWKETDRTNPLSVYGASKLTGEQAIQTVGGRFLIFRTSWVYGPHGKNFLLTMLRLGQEHDQLRVVDDQVGAPTSSIEIANATHTIIDRVMRNDFGAPQSWTGIYHMTCAGSVSWCGFAKAIFERAKSRAAGKNPEVLPIATSEYPTTAKRPLNSVLSNEKLAASFGIRLPPWDSALAETLLRLDGTDQEAKRN